MKVRNGLSSFIPTARLVAAIAVAWALIVGGAAAPVAASAEVASVTAPIVSAETSSTAIAVATTSSVAATPAVLVTAKAKKPKKLTVRQRVAKVGRSKGLSKAQVKALLWICKRESNFHPKSKSASGSYFGLFQLNRGMSHGHPWHKAVWNTKRAIRYMKGRYGGVTQAKAFWIKHHWY